MAFAFNTSGLIDHIRDAVAFADGFGWAVRYAGATGDAVFSNFHCHDGFSVKEFSTVQDYCMPPCASIDEYLLFGEFCHIRKTPLDHEIYRCFDLSEIFNCLVV